MVLTDNFMKPEKSRFFMSKIKTFFLLSPGVSMCHAVLPSPLQLSVSSFNVKGNFVFYQPGPHVTMFLFLMGTTIFEIGPVLRKNAVTGSCEPVCNVTLQDKCTASVIVH